MYCSFSKVEIASFYILVCVLLSSGGGVGVSDESDVMVTCVGSLFGWIAINHHPKVDFSSHPGG